jgi:hypothetical protein
VTQSDAHAWVEIHYERAGWVRYDPTPADLRTRAEAPLSLAGRIADLGSALELWWFQRVVGFDRADQIDALKRAWLAWHGRDSEHAPAPRHAATGDSTRIWRAVLESRAGRAAIGASLAAAAAAAALLRRRRARHDPGLHPCYARALRLLARRGLVRAPAATARAFTGEVAAALPAAVSAAFAQLTETYLRERFGAEPCDGARALARFEEALRSTWHANRRLAR